MSRTVIVFPDLNHMAPDVWLAPLEPRPMAELRLFCFPWSGAGVSVFRSWAAAMPAEIEMVGIQLPGRGARKAEPACDRLDPLVKQVVSAIRIELENSPGRFAFFGHSFGSLLAYEVTRKLEAEGMYPELVVLSGSRTPTVSPRFDLHRLPDVDLLEKIEAMGGVTADRFRDQGFLKYFLPLVRADLTACETHRSADPTVLSSPVSTWAGSDDWYARPEDVARWRDFAGPRFRGRLFSGGHFFTTDLNRTIGALLADLEWSRTSSTWPPFRSAYSSGNIARRSYKESA